MANHRMEPFIRHLRTALLRGDQAGLSDGQYLQRFIDDHDAGAFEALVRRHGRMVLGVCRRILGDLHDAEDCFQATFLVLVRKAASISPPERVGNWLYGVAQTTAIRVKAANFKRRGREKSVSQVPERAEVQADFGDNLQTLLDEELARLPDKYRTLIVLCDLEGRRHKEVANHLQIPEGTLSSRLTTARRLLAKRLARRGLTVSASLLTAIFARQSASACLPALLVRSTVKTALLVGAGTTAAGIVSVNVVALTEGVLKTMLMTKCKMAMTATLLLVLVGGGAGVIYKTQAAEPTKPSALHEPKPSQSNTTALGAKAETTPRPGIRRSTPTKPEEALSEVRLGQKEEEYNEIFDNVLDVVSDFFQVSYANRYEGRIETLPQSLVIQPIPLRRRAFAALMLADDGGFQVTVHVMIEADKKTSKHDEKNPLVLPHEGQAQSLSRDTLLEQAILRRVLELDRRRQADEMRKRQAKEEKPDHEGGNRERSNRIVLKNVHLDRVDPNRTISLVTLENGPGPESTYFINVAVAPDARIQVKGGNTFSNLKIGMRVRLELRVRDHRLVVTEIRQEGVTP